MADRFLCGVLSDRTDSAQIQYFGLSALPTWARHFSPTHAEASAPLQRHADIARHPARKIDDLNLQLVSAGPKVFGPQLMDLLGHAGERAFPARLLLIDGAALVGAQLVRKTIDLHLGPAIAHS